VNAFFCCVRFSFFPYQAKRLAWENVSEMIYFVWSGTGSAIKVLVAIHYSVLDARNGYIRNVVV